MILNIFYIAVLLSGISVNAKYIPRFNMDLDHEEHELLRSAYDTPSYDHDEEEQHEDEPGLANMDLLQDTKWAIKAKLQELKAFKTALKANMLNTKLQLKDLLKNHMGELIHHHHHHDAVQEHTKPEYTQYQNPPQYAAQHQYYPPNPQYAQQNYPPQQYRYVKMHDPYNGQ